MSFEKRNRMLSWKSQKIQNFDRRLIPHADSSHFRWDKDKGSLEEMK